MKLKHIVLLAILILLGLLVFHRIDSNRKIKRSKNVTAHKNGTPVTAMVIQPKRFSNTLTVSGSIEANESVTIQSEVSGIIESIVFKEGTMVQKGQLLFTINDTELQAQLLQAKSREQLTKENERRARLLLEKQAISQEEYDISLNELESAKAQRKLIEAQITKTRVTAPFSGKIGLRHVSKGAYVSPGTVITNLVDSDPVKITFAVPEKYVSEINTQAEIQFKIAGSKEIFKANIYAIEPQIDMSTRTLQIRALADNPENKLKPGTFASIELPLQDVEEAILIPTESIIPIQNGKKVFVKNKNTAREVIIETATRTEKEILVLSGLQKGDTLLTSGVMSLRNGSPIEVTMRN